MKIVPRPPTARARRAVSSAPTRNPVAMAGKATPAAKTRAERKSGVTTPRAVSAAAPARNSKAVTMPGPAKPNAAQ